MALDVTLSYTDESPNDDGTFTGTLTDSTVYGTGGNPARVDVAVYITGVKLNADDSIAADLTIATYDPTTADEFTFIIETDGWHEFTYVIIPDYNNATAYVQYDAVYSGGVVYRALGATTGNAPPNLTYWEVIATPTDLAENEGTASESLNIAFEIFDQVIYPYSKVQYGDATEHAALECCATCDRSDDVKAYEFINVMVNGMRVANLRSRWANGEKLARKAQQFTTGQ